MSDTTYYLKGNTYVDGDGNPALIKKGNQLVVTDNFAGGGGEPYVPPAYSTEEVDTGRKWIDGKEIYEKTLVFETPVNISVSSIGSIGVSSAGIDTILKAFAINNDGTTTSLTLAPRYLGETNLNARALGYGSSFAAKRIIFEYTKPTAASNTRKTTKKKG